ncbi:metalloproteinase inhibitor 1-like isoform X2 [Lytechinus variegatus]|nr:metalloproteinase inhibitor 1-like isoform X2 [Lytechinus variegatus]XP_041458463.1 metalloproteinase inhibitor 1-like isoform X2 [Lytechinus variegatus]
MAMKMVELLLVTVIIGCYLTPSMASSVKCSSNCLIMHPQQCFCDDDTVLKVKVTSRDYVNTENEIVVHAYSVFARYQARVLASFKESTFAKDDDDIFFYSPTFECAIPQLDLKEIYVIGGKVIDELLVISSCDGIAMKFDNLTVDQRRGFKNRYKDQCDFCTIQGAGTTKYFGGLEAELGEESGLWSPQGCFYNPIPSTTYGGEDCETLYSFCKPRPDTGVCEWEGTVDYDDCFTNREDIWFFTEKSQPAFTCRSQCKFQKTKLLKWRCARATKKLERQGYAPC